ncbi:hypothetical protein LTR95_004346 [Oleoguttula sp. CCFEE 5521]
MPFGRLSPVSETDSESIRTEVSDLRPRPLNFSRPRYNEGTSSRSIPRLAPSVRSSSSSSGASVHVMSAFHQPAKDLPDEPEFDLGLEDTVEGAQTDDGSSAATDLVWDDQLGELRTRRRDIDFDAQRSLSKPNGTNGKHHRSDTSGSTSTVGSAERPVAKQKHIARFQARPVSLPPSPARTPTSPPQTKASPARAPASVPTPAPTLPPKSPRIVKRTSFDQTSSHLSILSSTSAGAPSRAGQWEDNASHHTLSVNGDVGEKMDPVKRFNSSDHDISELSEKEIAKLKKKGINPQLYLEMKAARKGKGKWIGPLVGNTYM